MPPGLRRRTTNDCVPAVGEVRDHGHDAAVRLQSHVTHRVEPAEVDARPARAPGVGGVEDPLGQQDPRDDTVERGADALFEATHDDAPVGLEGD